MGSLQKQGFCGVKRILLPQPLGKLSLWAEFFLLYPQDLSRGEIDKIGKGRSAQRSGLSYYPKTSMAAISCSTSESTQSRP